MGKKTKEYDLGRSLIKNRFGGNSGRKMVADKSMLHTTELQDGYEWGRLNLQSITEESSFQEFLNTAELTGTEFEAEKLNIKFINPNSNVGLLSKDEMSKKKEVHNMHKALLEIPRRPPWNANMSREQLDQNERDYFLEWRRSLTKLQEDKGILLTPYEKNLEFWRQLWRVVERSDVVVQIVDARNPLLFRCEDLEKYVKEVSSHKINLVLINKADFLTEEQRQHWLNYFTALDVYVVFYSAMLATNPVKDIEEEEGHENLSANSDSELEQLRESVEKLESEVEKSAAKLAAITDTFHKVNFNGGLQSSKDILSRDQLIELFRSVHKGPKVTENTTTVGLVGYPNVGKSSTINSLFTSKKVSVSATPGKTKHFQTLYLDKDLVLCDCPGLVMPSFVFTKAEMVVNGILSIDQMRDHVPPVNLITSQIPRHVLEDKYGIMLSKPMEGEDPERCPTAEELLNAYGYNRGFMTANGQPDNARAARYILKDYMNGKLLYCHAPPSIDQSEYCTWPKRQKILPNNNVQPPRQIRAVKPNRVTSEDVDRSYVQNTNQAVHTKGKPTLISSGLRTEGVNADALGEKPWKKINKHQNKNKKEKLRRVYAHLDQH